MTGKECVQAVLNHQKPDRLPYVPCIDGYTQSGLSEKYRNMEVMEVEVLFGSDLIRGRFCWQESYGSDIKHTIKEEGVGWGTGTVTRTFETPKGTLKGVRQFTPTSPNIPFHVEHLVKTIEDLRTFHYIIENTTFVPDYSVLEDAVKKYPDQLVSGGVPEPPFRYLLMAIVGIERFFMLYFDHKEEVEALMEAIQAKFLEAVEIAIKGPAEVLISYANTNTANSSPAFIEQYEFPQLNEYARRIHEHGKKVLIHMCGKINLVIDQIADAEFDGVIDVPAPPTGDCDFPDAAQKLAAKGKILAGGIDCTRYIQKDTEKFIRETQEFVDSIQCKERFMLGSGDAVPQGATVENLLGARKLADETVYQAVMV
jgi:hypothetical protein